MKITIPNNPYSLRAPKCKVDIFPYGANPKRPKDFMKWLLLNVHTFGTLQCQKLWDVLWQNATKFLTYVSHKEAKEVT